MFISCMMGRKEWLLYALDFCVSSYTFVTERKALKDVCFVHNGKETMVALPPHTS
jgi:hypothetical protein